jgi:DNA polymerase III gamma/tau subunit
VLEIDGARFRGIDEVKELAYRAHLYPMGKRKVYIIDECHQLTEAAWNGMLKLLEEPPQHLVIILCTICQGVGINPDSRHLQFIAESAQGNMRAAENTLEQVCQLKSNP